MRRLGFADANLVRVAGDSVVVAYPFSGLPTAHRVHPRSHRPVWAMCAIDALGVLLMTADDGIVVSSDPDTAAPIRVERRDGRWLWEPEETVVVIGACESAAEGLCSQINFHTDANCAEAHLSAPGAADGPVLDQRTAVELADRTFGRLLSG